MRIQILHRSNSCEGLEERLAMGLVVRGSGERHFPFSTSVQTGFGVHPSSCTRGTGGQAAGAWLEHFPAL